MPLINNFVLWRDLAVVTAGSMIIFFLIIAVATGGEDLSSLLWVAGLVLCIMAALMVIGTLVLWVLTLGGPEAEFSISSRGVGYEAGKLQPGRSYGQRARAGKQDQRLNDRHA